MVQVTGKYTRTKEAKYKDFLSKLGVGFLTRQAATASTPTMEITETNGKWKMVTSTTLKSIVLEFELVNNFYSEKYLNFHAQNYLQGVEFDEDTPDGRKCKTTVTKDGDTMITMQKAQVKGQKDVKVIRKFTAAGIEVQMICEDVVSDQFFARN